VPRLSFTICDMNWQIFTPDFETIENFNDSAWVGHTFFAYDLIRNYKPKVVAELGTHKGTSFFSMLEASQDGAIAAELNAVDTWRGDEHAGFYSDDVYNSVQATIKKHFPLENTKLIRKTFDEANELFKPETIDILHIDGLHTYDAVKQDYETWKNKVRPDGVIMLHDIKVSEFGVKEVWEEIKKDYPDSAVLEFEHSFGLGVLFKDLKRFKFLADVNTKYLFHAYYKAQWERYDIRRQNVNYKDEVSALTKELNSTGKYGVHLNNEIVNLKTEIAHYQGVEAELRTIKKNSLYKVYKKILPSH